MAHLYQWARPGATLLRPPATAHVDGAISTTRPGSPSFRCQVDCLVVSMDNHESSGLVEPVEGRGGVGVGQR